MTKTAPSVGDTFGDIPVWRWSRVSMRFESEHAGHIMFVQFHKVGGRYSRSLPDGTPSPGGYRCYWTSEVDGDRESTKHRSAHDAKTAACAEYRRRFPGGAGP